MNINYLHKIAAGLALTVVFSSCMKDENSFGYEYMPDMYRSPAQEAYVDYGEVRTWKSNDSIKNTQSAKLPPMGTIPFQGANADPAYSMPYNRLPSNAMKTTHGIVSLEYNDGDYDASVADVNPMKMYESNVEHGKQLYNRFCTHCHGEKGAGDGSVSNSEYINPPANAFTRADGQMFYSITYGKGVMGAHASQLNKKERWEVISYIKSMNGEASIPDPVVAEMNLAATTEVEEVHFSKESLLSSLTQLADETAHDVNHSEAHTLNLDHLVYATGSSNLDMGKSQETLEVLVSFMKSSSKSLEFDGYTDNTGNAEANLQLSKDRANAVKTYLVEQGIDASRVEAQGFGDANPKASNDTPEGRAKNRRTEVKIK